MDKKVKIIKSSDGYEALYLNNELVDQGDPINEGNDRGLYFLKFAAKHNLKAEDFGIYFTNEEGDELLEKQGYFPKDFNEFIELVHIN